MKKYLLKGIIFGIGFSLTLLLTLVGYGAWVNLTTQNSGDTITSTIWNNLINNVNDLNISKVPSGAIMAFNLSVCPDGWFVADGTNGTPDLRGQFIRGLDNGKGIDIGRTLASFQGDTIRNLTGAIKGVAGLANNAYDWGFQPGTYGAFSVSYGNSTYNKYGGAYSVPSGNTATFDASSVVPTSNENRPVNVALLYCVKQ